MSRSGAVIKREFLASVRSRTFLFGTLFGPIIMIGALLVPVLLAKKAEENQTIAIVDLSGRGIGQDAMRMLDALVRIRRQGDSAQVAARRARAAHLRNPSAGATLATAPPMAAQAGIGHTDFDIRLQTPALQDTVGLRDALAAKMTAGDLDGYLWIPAEAVAGERAEYISKNVPGFSALAQLRTAVQSAVQQRRLENAGLDPREVAGALRPIAFDARKLGAESGAAAPELALIVATFLGLLVYMVVILYGNGIMRGVLEEKRDRIVEVILSSIRARDLMLGKVLGIGAAGLTQVLVWFLFAGVLVRYGATIAERTGATLPPLPSLPLPFVATFLVFFTIGFLLYSALYASMGAIVTSDQEAQQLQFPVLLPLIAAVFMQQSVITDPEGPVAVWGSIIPLTSPIIMPVRAYLSDVPFSQIAAAAALGAATVLTLLWLAAKIYRIGILSTGKRPTMAELWRWLRTA